MPFLDRTHGKIAYDDMGSGPLAVLVPGLGDLKEEYRFLSPRLVAAGYRVIAMDLRGHGEASAVWPDYSCTALGSDIVALIAHLNTGPALVVGTSMGAGAAVCAAAEAPAHVAALVLIGPFVRDIPVESRFKALMQTLTIKAAFGGPWAPGAWGAYYASLYPTKKPADFADYRAALVANLREPGRMNALRAMMSLSKADVEARIATVRTRTLVVMGSKDPDFTDPAREAATVARLLNGTVAMIEGAGHYPHAEMPEATAPAILGFLSKRKAA